VAIGHRISDALHDACHPRARAATSVGVMEVLDALVVRDPLARLRSVVAAFAAEAASSPTVVASVETGITDVEALVARLFEEEGRPLVRLARLFVDDRNAAEDLVQEGFIRLARNAGRIRDESKAAAYLRSIVLNLARDHNRRGLVSLRHHLPFDDLRASAEDEIVLRDDQQEVIDALRDLPHRQRDCLVLRYYEELGIDDIAGTLAISRNSVKTHLKRGLVAMEKRLGVPLAAPDADLAVMGP
jgi:RNA polymerase sigma factor (sigma-70 family)